MGTVLSTAFADIKDKAETLRSNYEFWCEGLCEDFMSMQQIAEEEDGSGVLHCNGENNADICKDINQSSQWKTKYASTARHLVRLGWFTNYMVALFEGLINDPDKSLSTIAKESYEEHLGPNHGWFIRQAATLGFSAACSREYCM
jgi:hypothetical protein